MGAVDSHLDVDYLERVYAVRLMIHNRGHLNYHDMIFSIDDDASLVVLSSFCKNKSK